MCTDRKIKLNLRLIRNVAKLARARTHGRVTRISSCIPKIVSLPYGLIKTVKYAKCAAVNYIIGKIFHIPKYTPKHGNRIYTLPTISLAPSQKFSCC